ncbi:MAG: Hsp20/alpha crystallin family protein [Cyanobacteria bacterium P01_A01_bin.84]
MKLAVFNPWNEFNTLERSFNHLLNDFAPASLREIAGNSRVPSAEITENEESIILKLELPGMEAKDLDIQVTENAVSISGERKSESETEENGYRRTEFYYGKFSRVIPLNTKVQNSNVKADYKNGILHLTLPKSTEEKSKVVKVNLEQS